MTARASTSPCSESTAPAEDRMRTRGFTLIELLTVIAIIGILAAILLPTLGYCRRQANKSREVSAARQMMIAFQLAADERKGIFLSENSNNHAEAMNEGGAAFSAQGGASSKIAARRWPHHLRPYLGNRFKGVLYVNEQAEYYDKHVGDDYGLTLGTTFGMNGNFVGATAATGIKDRPVRRVQDAELPSKLIAFTSAHDRTVDPHAGYFSVGAPYGWPAEDLAGLPDDLTLDRSYGRVAFRHGGKAVAIFLDGHVELLRCAPLRDMRLWSDQARRTDNPDYAPSF